MIRPEDLLRPEKAGLYCPIGDFYIDPTRKVDRAVITHGHADHARAGHGAVLATPETLAIMAVRYGKTFTKRQDALSCGQSTSINGVKIHFTPAGHILGSVQVTVEWKGLRITCTGDYKRKPDPTCTPFETVASDVFITEATFALPVFNQPDPDLEIDKLFNSLNTINDRPHFVSAYSLGKTQRIIKMARNKGFDAPITITPPAKGLCDLYEAFGVELGPLRVLEPEDTD